MRILLFSIMLLTGCSTFDQAQWDRVYQDCQDSHKQRDEAADKHYYAAEHARDEAFQQKDEAFNQRNEASLQLEQSTYTYNPERHYIACTAEANVITKRYYADTVGPGQNPPSVIIFPPR